MYIALFFILMILYIIISGRLSDTDSNDKKKLNEGDKEQYEIKLPQLPSDMYYFDKVSYVMKDEEYRKGDIEYKSKVLCKLLDEFIQQGIIEKYDINLQNDKPYIICYLCDGGSFMILLTEFKEKQNQ